jgi:hypothetical protein
MKIPIYALAAVGLLTIAAIGAQTIIDHYRLCKWECQRRRKKGEETEWDFGHIPIFFIEGQQADELLSYLQGSEPANRSPFPTQRDLLEWDLIHAEETEDYERAAQIRDELNRMQRDK